MQVLSLIFLEKRNETDIFFADFIKKYKNSCKILYSNKLYPLGEKLKFTEKENGLLKIKLISYEKIPSIYRLPYNCLGIQVDENKDIFLSHFLKNNKKKSKTIYENQLYQLQNKFIFLKKGRELYKIILVYHEKFFEILANNCLGIKRRLKLNLNHFENPCQFQDLSKMVYDIGENATSIQIFGEKFVENNKNKCIIIYKNQILPIQTYFPFNFISKEDKKLELLLIELEDITNRSYMFANCEALEEFSFVYEAQKEIKEGEKGEEKGLFFEYTDFYSKSNNIEQNEVNYSNIISTQDKHSLTNFFLDKTKWKTCICSDLSFLFAGCQSLKSLPDLSRWETNNVKSMCGMFYKCKSLQSLPNISNWNTENVTNISGMFRYCSSLTSLPDISNWNIINVKDINSIFVGCKRLLSLPDISKWNTINVIDMSYLFGECSLLQTLPDISKWKNKTKNVTRMRYMFLRCSSLLSLPDISEWDTSSLNDMMGIFSYSLLISPIEVPTKNSDNNISERYSSLLISLPDISKWNTSNVTNMSGIFYQCESLKSLPDISKWNTNKVTQMDNMFKGCKSLIFLPDISKWNTDQVTKMNSMFDGCNSLISLPDLSNWNTGNVTNMRDMFNKCSLVSILPDISKWNTDKVTDMSKIFLGCSSLISLPDISKWNMNNCNNIFAMFKGCISLSYLPDISKWHFSSTLYKFDLFNDCLSTINIIDN